MSEPLSAICTAQLGKHDDIIGRRHRTGMLLHSLLSDIPGIIPTKIQAEDTHSFYNYIFRLDLDIIDVTRSTFAAALQAEGVNAEDGYLPAQGLIEIT